MATVAMVSSVHVLWVWEMLQQVLTELEIGKYATWDVVAAEEGDGIRLRRLS